MFESDFQEFEENTQEHAEFPISNHEHFKEPTKEMSSNKHIKCSLFCKDQ